MIKGLVSVIVTCYNQEHCIIRTLESVANQTYTNLECIVVDDESSDKSNQVIKKYIQKDNRFKLIRHANKGLARSRNAGFRIALGEYIQFLDGDDTLLPEKLKLQEEALFKNQGAKVCICKSRFFIEGNNTYKYHDFEKLSSQPLEQLIYKWNMGVSFTPHSPIYKREIWDIDELPFQEDYHYWCEDWVFNVLLAMKGFKYVILDEVLCNYHMHEENFTSNKTDLIAAAIHAAKYLHPKLPNKYKKDFIEHTITNLLEMYRETEKVKILQESKNWRIANAISKPFINFLKRVKE